MTSAVGRAYATALLAVAQDKGLSPSELDRIDLELAQLLDVIKGSPELSIVLFGGIGTDHEKHAVVTDLGAKLGLSPFVMNFLHLLSDKRRLMALQDVVDMLKVVRLEFAGGLLGDLVSAEALSSSDVQDLESSFSKKLGKKVSFQATTDPALLAGVRVTVGGVTHDGSLLAQLKRARASLIVGSSLAQSV